VLPSGSNNMSRAEARRRLQEADPNLTIVYGRRYPKGRQGLKIGYRRGRIGEYSGLTHEERREAAIAWRSLNYEYHELGNKGNLQEVARFLNIEPTDWDSVLGEFRRRYGDARGIWLTRTKKDSRLYAEYGEAEPVPYREENVIVDLGPDGIYVLMEDQGTERSLKTITIPGRRYPYAQRKDRIPKLLDDEEAEWLGLEEMFPIIPPPKILEIEGMWSKPDLQDMAWRFGIDPRGADKQALVELLLWAGVLDEDGHRTDKQPPPRR